MGISKRKPPQAEGDALRKVVDETKERLAQTQVERPFHQKPVLRLGTMPSLSAASSHAKCKAGQVCGVPKSSCFLWHPAYRFRERRRALTMRKVVDETKERLAQAQVTVLL